MGVTVGRLLSGVDVAAGRLAASVTACVDLAELGERFWVSVGTTLALGLDPTPQASMDIMSAAIAVMAKRLLGVMVYISAEIAQVI
jgi:hypothetical protein